MLSCRQLALEAVMFGCSLSYLDHEQANPNVVVGSHWGWSSGACTHAYQSLPKSEQSVQHGRRRCRVFSSRCVCKHKLTLLQLITFCVYMLHMYMDTAAAKGQLCDSLNLSHLRVCMQTWLLNEQLHLHCHCFSNGTSCQPWVLLQLMSLLTIAHSLTHSLTHSLRRSHVSCHWPCRSNSSIPK